MQLLTVGCETVDMTLRRNGLGQLGFHVRLDGTVAEVLLFPPSLKNHQVFVHLIHEEPCLMLFLFGLQVEEYGFAWQAGLRQGSRLVEICKVAAVTLTHEQMIDLLRTSVTVKVVIIPPYEEGGPRRYVHCSTSCPINLKEWFHHRSLISSTHTFRFGLYVLVYRGAACTINNAEQNICLYWENITTHAPKHCVCVCVFALSDSSPCWTAGSLKLFRRLHSSLCYKLSGIMSLQMSMHVARCVMLVHCRTLISNFLSAVIVSQSKCKVVP